MCFSLQRRAIFQHLNFKKWSENVVFCTFSLENVLLATEACNFSTSQLQKVVRSWRVLYIFTWKCAWRAIFQHLNFKKWSENLVFCTFSLENVLLATAACNFSTSQLQKVVRSWRVLYIFTSKCASRHSGVRFLISPLTTWLRTRRFNEPTFRLTRHTNHWKNTAFRDFSNIWRGCIFFLLTFAQLHLLSSDSTFSSDFTFFWLYFISSAFHLCFSTLHIVGSLLFKLPSIRIKGLHVSEPQSSPIPPFIGSKPLDQHLPMWRPSLTAEVKPKVKGARYPCILGRPHKGRFQDCNPPMNLFHW